jgi:alkanesulfonate monooxygenase SsuD/methylene tetrahydromethanopterin reductase-like flavin-dependent oxidoreductase (luciferase family)
MHGSAPVPTDPGPEKILREVVANYDMTRHAQRAASQAHTITREFAEYFAIIGPPEDCAVRLRQLADLGIDRFHVWGYPPVGPADGDRFAESVLPLLKA